MIKCTRKKLPINILRKCHKFCVKQTELLDRLDILWWPKLCTKQWFLAAFEHSIKCRLNLWNTCKKHTTDKPKYRTPKALRLFLTSYTKIQNYGPNNWASYWDKLLEHKYEVTREPPLIVLIHSYLGNTEANETS